ncbi:MAG: ECF transporter S component [Arachnia propionica]|uniref:ECF transporter S component n=1 Tax=Arachnia propionica TaxID=1750 RepID=UPI00270CE1FF|nr:ECF transporter S component [Arachnia propionica]
MTAGENDTLQIHTARADRPGNSVLHTRTLMTVAACAVVGAVVVIPLSYVSITLAVSPVGIMAVCSLMGLWLLPFMLPGALTQKPGAIMIAALIIGIIGTFTTPSGVSSILGNLIGGALVEIPLALLFYKHWNWLGYGLAASTFGLFNGLLYSSMLQIQVTTPELLLMGTIALLSSLVGVVITLVVVRSLRRAGIGVRNH